MKLNISAIFDTTDLLELDLEGMLVALIKEIGQRGGVLSDPVIDAMVDFLSLSTLQSISDRMRSTRRVITQAFPTPELETSLVHEEKRLLIAGDKIMAIRDLRFRTGCGLREAKDTCEAWLRNYKVRQAELIIAALDSGHDAASLPRR